MPFWLISAFAGFRGMIEIWPPILVAGLSFAIMQYIVSNYHGPWLVDVIAAIVSMVCLSAVPARLASRREDGRRLRSRGTRPTRDRRSDLMVGEPDAAESAAVFKRHDRRAVMLAWMPWLILTVFVFIWGIPEVKKILDGISIVRIPFEGLHLMIEKVPPCRPPRTRKRRSTASTGCRRPEPEFCSPPW